MKKTSLYDLAVRCGIGSPSEFVERFIHYERETGEGRMRHGEDTDL